MKLIEIRQMQRATRAMIAKANNCSQMKVRTLEMKKKKDLTFGDLDFYSKGLMFDSSDLITFITGLRIPESELKSHFWELNINRTMNVNKTYRKLASCSNKCSIVTLQTYANELDKFKNIKLNWCYYLITGKELED